MSTQSWRRLEKEERMPFERGPLRACRQRRAGRIRSSSSVQSIEFKRVNVGGSSAAIASDM